MTAIDFDRAGDPAFVMDPEHGRILAANDAGCELLGYTRAELLETPISEIHPAELKELTELLQRVLRDQCASTIKLTCRTKQGVFLPTEISLHTLMLNGRLRILGLVQDRSEHRACPPTAEQPHSPNSAASDTLRGTEPTPDRRSRREPHSWRHDPHARTRQS